MQEKCTRLLESRKTRSADEAARHAAKYQDRLSPRARLEHLFDDGRYMEFGTLGKGPTGGEGDCVITAVGRVAGRTVYAYCQDYTQMGGSLGAMQAQKISQLQEKALKAGCPIIALLESGGARIQEGVGSLDGYGRIFSMNVKSSGRIPQLAIVFGACAGGASYSPALMDFIITVRGRSRMFITGPDVIKTVVGETVQAEELGGASVLGSKSGVSHFTAEDEDGAIATAKAILSYLGQPMAPGKAPVVKEGDWDFLPEVPNRAYDMHQVVEKVFDQGSILEYQKDWGRNAMTAFARLNGRAVAVVANQPAFMAGCIDIDASDKMSRFIRMADAFGLPIITFVDTPGYLPGVKQEHDGIIRHGAKLLYAYAEAGNPRITVIVRKAYGGAYIAMGSKAIGADAVFAYPFAEVAVMGAEAAVKIVRKKDLAAGADAAALADEYRNEVMNPSFSAHMDLIDELIVPSETRDRLIMSLSTLCAAKPGEHGNIPL